MQNIDLICIGKLNMPFYAAGVAEYQKRLAAFCNFRIVELPEAAIDERHASAAQVEKALEKEAKPSWARCARANTWPPSVWRAGRSPARSWPT